MLLVSLFLIPIFGVIAILVNNESGASLKNAKLTGLNLISVIRKNLLKGKTLIKTITLGFGGILLWKTNIIFLVTSVTGMMIFILTLPHYILIMKTWFETLNYVIYKDNRTMGQLLVAYPLVFYSFIQILYHLCKESRFLNEYPFHGENYPVFLALGLALMILDILYGVPLPFYVIKEKLRYAIRLFIKNPFSFILMGISVFVILMYFVSKISGLFGVYIVMDSWELYFISIVTRLILIKTIYSTIYLVIVTFIGKHSFSNKEWYNSISLSCYSVLGCLTFTYFAYYYILPFTLLYKLGIIKSIRGLHSLNQWHLSLNLTNWFFIKSRDIGIYLISLYNYPAKLGKFLIEISNYFLEIKPKSIVRGSCYRPSNTLSDMLSKEGLKVKNLNKSVWFFGFEAMHYLPSIRIPDDWIIIPNMKQQDISPRLWYEEYKNNLTSLGEVFFNNSKTNKLTSNLYSNCLIYDPLKYSINKPVLKDNSCLPTVYLEEPWDNKKYYKSKWDNATILDLTAPPKGGYKVNVYMAQTNDLLTAEYNSLVIRPTSPYFAHTNSLPVLNDQVINSASNRAELYEVIDEFTILRIDYAEVEYLLGAYHGYSDDYLTDKRNVLRDLAIKINRCPTDKRSSYLLRFIGLRKLINLGLVEFGADLLVYEEHIRSIIDSIDNACEFLERWVPLPATSNVDHITSNQQTNSAFLLPSSSSNTVVNSLPTSYPSSAD